MQNNIISLKEYRKKKIEETAYHSILTREEAVRLVDALFLGQGSCSEEDAQKAFQWAEKAKINSFVLQAILDGYSNCIIDDNGMLEIVEIES